MNSRRWDDWVPEERVRKLNEENKELAANLTRDYKRALKEAAAAKKPPPPALTSKRKSLLGSDVASFRDSEERASSTQALPRGTKRARDTEIEKASTITPFLPRLVQSALDRRTGSCSIRIRAPAQTRRATGATSEHAR